MASRVRGGLAALIAGLCVVMVAVGVGIGALIWAGDDDSSNETSSESAEARANVTEDEAADGGAGGDGEDSGDAANDSVQSISVYVDGYANVKPVYDFENNCVKNDANTPGPVSNTQVTLTVTVTGGVFEKCGYEESKMHWVFETPRAGGSFENVYLHKPAGGEVRARCGGGINYYCATTPPDPPKGYTDSVYVKPQ
jgi:hypothetical protein